MMPLDGRGRIGAGETRTNVVSWICTFGRADAQFHRGSWAATSPAEDSGDDFSDSAPVEKPELDKTALVCSYGIGSW
jgi:hypothetical protein